VSFSPIQRISAAHDMSDFDCGSDAQSTWLRRYALQADRIDSTRVWVITRKADPRIVAYYALSAGSVEHASAPPRVRKAMPGYPVPVIILTRLGVDRSVQGLGLGRELVRDLLLRVAGAAETIGARALLVHCESANAKDFYLDIADFEPSPTDPLHLYLLLSELRRYAEDRRALGGSGPS
jgi:GNAT superfamily N-acetyltransferase